jgi:hypothetical protein
LAFVLEELRRGEIKWPEGCEVTYDLKALDLLTGLLKGSSRGDALEAYYLDFRERTGERPKALDIYHAGFKPRTTGHGDWLSFVDHQGDLSGVERQVLERHRGLLDTLATMQMKRSHKILLVQAMQREGAFPGAIEVDQLAARMAQLAARNPSLRRDINADLSKKNELRRIIETGPIAAWVEGWGASGRRYFTYKDGLFSTAFEATGLQRQSLNDLVEEIVDWRLADYLGSDPSDPEVGVAEEPETPFEGPQPLATQGASLWREYMREEIPGLYGLKFSTGSWNQGFVVQGDKHVFLLVTLKKDGLQEAYH